MRQQANQEGATEFISEAGAQQVTVTDTAVGQQTPGREGGSRSIAAIGSRIISTVLQPLLMPLYALLIVINGNSFVSVMVSTKAKVFLALAITLLTLLLPGMVIGILNALGALEDFRMNNRRERILPLVIILVSYIFCAWLVFEWTKIDIIFMALMSAVACIALAIVVTSFWKISLHMMGMGGIYALLFVLGIVEFSDFTWVMVVATFLAGLLASARLYLGRHTPMQVAAGFTGGFVVAMLTMMFI